LPRKSERASNEFARIEAKGSRDVANVVCGGPANEHQTHLKIKVVNLRESTPPDWTLVTLSFSVADKPKG
jgi:hypothetical protein